ncbi:MAG: hypothetical protein R3B95_19585 [Nitrospirales bacterium]|nr:hypothetical protein [Nitrospirales bacterium]
MTVCKSRLVEEITVIVAVDVTLVSDSNCILAAALTENLGTVEPQLGQGFLSSGTSLGSSHSTESQLLHTTDSAMSYYLKKEIKYPHTKQCLSRSA